jgi:uncharacterized membrane protein YjjB (DUF3815 family)
MNIEISIIEKIIWSGIAATGFAILFNVPKRLLISVFSIGAIAGFIKFTLLLNETGIIFSTLLAASFVGFSSIPIARYKHTSPFVVSIPSIIPMIPGYFGYKTLLGIMKLAMSKNTSLEGEILMSVLHNGLNMTFVLASISIGVSLPWLLFREKGLKKIKLTDNENLI